MRTQVIVSYEEGTSDGLGGQDVASTTVLSHRVADVQHGGSYLRARPDTGLAGQADATIFYDQERHVEEMQEGMLVEVPKMGLAGRIERVHHLDYAIEITAAG